MVKWIDTCQVSQEVFSPKRPPVHPQLGPPFWSATQALPLCTRPSPPPCGMCIGSRLRGPRSRLRGHGRAMSDFTTFSWIPETTIKKQVLKEATFFTVSYASTRHVTLSYINAGDKRNESLSRIAVHISSSVQAG